MNCGASKTYQQGLRPIIIAGQGVRLAKAIPEFKRFVGTYKDTGCRPLLGSVKSANCASIDIGVIGIKGSRAGNLAMQNADLVISMGSRLSVTAIGYEYEMFAREATKVVIDIDPVEHQKKTINIDLFINADIKELFKRFKLNKKPNIEKWRNICLKWKKKYPVCLPEYRKNKKGISLYYFVDTLTKKMKPDAVVLSDAGSAFYVATQGIHIKDRQRYITSGGQAEMGYTLPASIGASVARRGKEVLGITGDGSFQMNIQELQTIVHYQLPVKLFVWNNNGYLSIRATQNKFFNGRLIGTDLSSGVSFPDTRKIANAYGIKYFKLAKSATLEKDLEKVLAYEGAVICEVMCMEDDRVIPTAASMKKEDGTMVSKPLEDMFPFLDRKEFLENMIIKPLEE
jgi:acetolactate synthase-1/2/3 large subunit